MPAFLYKVRDKNGELVTGIAHGDNQESVASELFGRGYTPVEVKLEKEAKAGRAELFGRLTPEDLIVFSRQFATLIKAGISFMRCLDTLHEQTKSRRLKEVITAIRRDVEAGTSFSEALSIHPRVFSPLYISMVKVGEEAGVLDDILERLASLLEHEAVTRARIKTATRYPMLVLAVLLIAFVFLTAFVVPKFAGIYGSAKVELPLATRVLIFLNIALTRYWMVIIGVVAGTVFLARGYIKTPSGRWNWDKLKLKAPILGPIVERAVMSRFARIFSTLYRSGIPMLHSLDIVSGTLGNVTIGRAVDIIKEDVREGKGLSQPMAKTGAFPPIVVQMVAVGEETGALDEMLIKVSDYYDLEVEYAIKNLSTTIEPILVFILAGAVLFLALGIFLPIWDIISVMKR
ncbi:MAG: type II secretion system F family protein [Thermodesulfovibrionales bacterium]|nr:type II secretion system F family protein [Thermodesulfovibrionales bacterium]